MKPYRSAEGGVILVCPCEKWQVDVSAQALLQIHPAQLRDTVEEALLAHEAECIVLAATRIALQAAH